MPKMVKQGTSRLYELQHQDGGWGWWSNDETDPFMTAYVIYGLTIAKIVGYPVDDNKYNLGVSELSKLLVKIILNLTIGISMTQQQLLICVMLQAWLVTLILKV